MLLKVHKVFLNDKPVVQNVSVDAPPGVSCVTHFLHIHVYGTMMFIYILCLDIFE